MRNRSARSRWTSKARAGLASGDKKKDDDKKAEEKKEEPKKKGFGCWAASRR